jgi:hypothetical protein
MSLICGIFAHDAGRSIPSSWRDTFQRNLSRKGHGTLVEHEGPGVYLAKLNIGAFETPGWRVAGASIAAMGGDSLLPTRPVGAERDADLETLASAPADKLAALLRPSRGQFALVTVREPEHELVLATDRLGVRPIYVFSNGDFVVFSSVLRLIEALPDTRLTADLQGTLEEAAFGISIGDRTRYAEVKSLRGATILRAKRGSIRTDEYWRWDTGACQTIVQDTTEGMQRLHAAFADSVRIRLGKNKAVFAALSGGLDSRCVVTELRAQNAEVHTLNVSWKGSQDEVFGKQYADAIGAIHHPTVLPDEQVGGQVAILVYESLMANGHVLSHEPAKHRVWGGDGGSVGIGHVYLSPPVVRLMREQGPEAATREFLRYNTIALAQKAFRADYGNYAANLPLRTMTDELKRLDCRDPARALFVFLLENDQRRHLTAQWELFDLYPHEFVEPFYDPEVLTAACQLPLDFCLRHHMYHQWLRTFSEPAYTIPWQSYPGHEACPVKVPDGLMSQFGVARGALTAVRREQAKKDAQSAIRNLGMLRSYLSVPVLLGAYLAFQLRISEPLYIFKQVGLLSKVVNRCEGRVQALNAHP